MYYVVLRVSDGEPVYIGKSSVSAASVWLPGTVHGKGESRSDALASAERARAFRRECDAEAS